MSLRRMGECKALAVRGAVCLIHGVIFEGARKPRSKFCVLLEDYVEGKRDIILAFGTSNLEFKHILSSFLIPCGSIPDLPEDTLVQLDNWRILPTGQFFGKQVFYVGQLSVGLVRDLDKALEHFHTKPEVWIRMRGWSEH